MKRRTARRRAIYRYHERLCETGVIATMPWPPCCVREWARYHRRREASDRNRWGL